MADSVAIKPGFFQNIGSRLDGAINGLRNSQPRKVTAQQAMNTFLYPLASTEKTRQTRTEERQWGRFRAIEEPPDPQSDWITLDIDELTVNTIPTERLLMLLKSVSPQIGKACWDFQQFGNSSWKFETDGGEGSPGHIATQRYLDRIAENGMEFNTIIDKLFQSAFIRGAYFYETVIQGRTPVGFSVLDPITARYRPASERDKRRGKDSELGQLQEGEFVPMRGETVTYAPVNSNITSNYGVSMIDSCIFAAVFMIGLLYDVRRVISQQGYYRLDVSLDMEKMMQKAAREKIPITEMDEWLAKQMERIRKFYDELNPSDSFMHTDDVTVEDISGAMNSQGLGALSSVIDLLRNDLTLACKSIPILMGINNSTSETHANRQWENYMGTIRSCQLTLATSLNKSFTLALRYQGIQDNVRFQFRELSATTAMMLAQTDIATLEVIDKALNMRRTGIDAEGRETIAEEVPLMTNEEAMNRWRRVEELR